MEETRKKMKGKVVFKHGTEAYWNESSYIPANGEMVLYDEDGEYNYKRVKYGNGNDTVSKLPFSISADLLEGVVRYNKEQTLTEEEKAQARENIGVGDIEGFVSYNKEQTLTNNQKSQALTNISADIGFCGALPGSLKWDGVIGNRHKVELGSSGAIWSGFVRITDEMPLLYSAESVDIGCVLVNMQRAFPIAITLHRDPENGLYTAGFNEGEDVSEIPQIIIVPYDNYDFGGIILQKGVYVYSFCIVSDGNFVPYTYISAISIPFYSFNDAPSYNDLKDKPFGGSSGNTVYFDGKLTEPYVEIPQDGALTSYFVKISDSVPAAADIQGKTLTSYIVSETSSGRDEDVESWVFPGQNDIIEDDGSIVLGFPPFLIIPSDNYEAEGLTFPSKGVYAMLLESHNADTGMWYRMYSTQLTIPDYTFHTTKPLDEKYLPSATLLYADEENYLYATSDKSDTSKRMTCGELNRIVLSGNKILLCFSNVLGGINNLYMTPTGFSFNNGVGYLTIYDGLALRTYYTAEYQSSETTQTEVN